MSPQTEAGSSKPATNLLSQVSSVFSTLYIKTPEQLELKSHEALLGLAEKSSTAKLDNSSRLEEVRNAPLFTRGVRSAINTQAVDVGQRGIENLDIFPQYGLIGRRAHPKTGLPGDEKYRADRDLIYANMNAPWSAFICGSQGAGKSHTFSCLLENALLLRNPGGVLPDPLTGIVFHYDKFTSHSSTQLCEAAFLCSKGIPVQILVSPSNIHAMQALYSNIPGLLPHTPRPQVRALKFHEDHLNVGNMKTLMAVDAGAASPPLYLAVLDKILRDMAKERAEKSGFDYDDFKRRLYSAGFTEQQLVPLSLRLQLLEEFLDQSKPSSSYKSVFNYGKGSLTIVDLSCPFVDENDACALFSICLSLFLEQRNAGGRIIALDEAHKFLTKSGEAENFTEELLSVIRQQRHLASRVVISTQEPTLSPQLLELCNVTFVHRFRSPRWLEALKNHIAGAANLRTSGEGSLEEMFKTIVGLRTGEALVFSPDSLLDIGSATLSIWQTETTIFPLLDRFVKVYIRDRISADGGKSIMASDKIEGVAEATDTDSAPLASLTEEMSEDDEPPASTRRTQSPQLAKKQDTYARTGRQPSSSQSISSAIPCSQSVNSVTAVSIERCLRRQTRQYLNESPKIFELAILRKRMRQELDISRRQLLKKITFTTFRSILSSEAVAWSHETERPLPEGLELD